MSDVTYLCYEFPPLSQTFVYNELLELRRQGCDVSLMAVRSPAQPVMSEEALELAGSCHYLGRLGAREASRALMWWARNDPRRLCSTLRLATASAPSLTERARLLYHLLLALHVARTRDLSDVRILHVHFAGAAADIALGLHRLLDLPISIVAHAGELYAGTNALGEKLAVATPFITISEYNRTVLRRRFGRLADKVAVVHCGVDLKALDRFRGPTRRADVELDAGPATPVVLAVGRLDAKKGHDTLIRACGLLRREGIALRCRILGGGPLEPELRLLIEDQDLHGTVELLGPRDHAEVIALLADATVAALACRVAPSGDQDGIPVSLMEAMALGVPVVSTRVSGIPELVSDGKNGLLVEPDNPRAFANALREMIQNADRRRVLGEAARQTVEQFFALERCGAMTRRLLATATERSTSR